MADPTAKSPPEAPPTPSRDGHDEPPAVQRGRRVARACYYALMAAVAVASTVQITRQVYFSPAPDLETITSCSDGLRRLHLAVDAGRDAAAQAASEGSDEEQALSSYRRHVERSWRARDLVAKLCRGDPAKVAALDALERLRYSEEHSLRTHGTELIALRRRVHQLLGDPDETPTGP